MNAKYLGLLILATGVFFTAAATIINVPDDFETIQGAIDEAEDGDTVLVQPGEYVETINFEGRAITVASLMLTTGNEAYINSTIIDGNRGGSVVRFDSEEDETSILTGFSITSGTGSPDIRDDLGGGGIHCLRSSPTLRHLKVLGNEATYGGGIFIQFSSPRIEFVSVYNNAATQNGGGIYCSRQDCQPTISHSLVYRNSSRNGGGLACWGGASPLLEHVTLAFNSASSHGGGIWTDGDINHIRIRNTILWSNSRTQIDLGNFGSRDTLTVRYSDVQSGENGVRHGSDVIIWGDGNIDNNPQFIDPDEDDYHLTEDSPCIDVGDPDSCPDPDGTRPDMGVYPFVQGSATVIEGFVLDVNNDEPLEGASISTNFEAETVTDASGFWRISPARILPFDITVSLQDYVDSTLFDFEVQPFDTTEINFGLLHAEFIPSRDTIAVTLEPDSSIQTHFTIRNPGSGLLAWEGTLDVQGAPEPWTFLRTLPDGERLGNQWRGVIFADDSFYVSDASGYDLNIIYVLDREGNHVRQFRQPGETRYGMADLAWDGELIWGGSEDTIFGFTTDGELVSSFQGSYNQNYNLTWDTDRELLWTSGTVTDIVGYSREGEERAALEGHGFRIYGLAYWSDDPGGYQLYVFHYPSEFRQIVHKINIETGDALFVCELMPEGGGRPRGAFVTTQYDRYGSWLFMDIADSPEGDRIDIWQLASNPSWMNLEPIAGVVGPGESQDLTLTLDSRNLPLSFYPGELRFSHNGFGGELNVPVNLTVNHPNSIEMNHPQPPTEFRIVSIHPNPFNSTTTVAYSLPAASNVLISLYDLQGRQVKSMLKEHRQPGYYRYEFHGNELPSGLYILRFSTPEASFSKKIALIR